MTIRKGEIEAATLTLTVTPTFFYQLAFGIIFMVVTLKLRHPS